MAAQILSGSVTPTGNYTLYTNNTGGNVRLIIHHLFVHGKANNNEPDLTGANKPSGSSGFYSTRRVNITGGSHGTLQLPSNLYYQAQPSRVVRIRLGVGKDIGLEERYDIGELPAANKSAVRVTVTDSNNGLKFAEGPQIFPTEILMRPNQSMVFEASSSSELQFISFNITVMPEGG